MPRSTKKGPHVDHHLLEKVMMQLEEDNKKPIKTYSRRSCILPEFVGMRFLVHNGKTFTPLFIVAEMVGKKLGSFVMTRMYRGHAADKKSKK